MAPFVKWLGRNSLLVNSIYLMMATFAVAGFGFLFWVVVSRSYSVETVGLTATLLSLSSLISMLSLAGFDTALVKFLPKTSQRQAHINTSIVAVTGISFVLSLLFVLSLPITAPSLAFVTQNPWYAASFIFFTIVTSQNVLTNAIFLAGKYAKDILTINILFSVVKVVLPLIVVRGDAMMLFALAGWSQLVGVAISFGMIRIRFTHRFSAKIHVAVLREVKKYSCAVYAASILNLLPPTLLPLLIVHDLGAEAAAYYYMAFTIASVLYTICYSTMQSVFAEGAHDEAALKAHLIKAGKFMSVLLLPAIVATLLLSNFMLELFGKNYAREGAGLLQLFAVGALAVLASSAMGAIFKVTKQLKNVVIINIVYAGVILGVSYAFMAQVGIVAIGWAWMCGNAAAAATGLVLLWRHFSHSANNKT